MFGIGWAEFLVLGLVGLFLFGPERLPGLAKDAARLIRQLRQMAQGVTDDLKAELGPEVHEMGLESLRELRELREFSPRRLVTRTLFDDEPADLPARPMSVSVGPRSGATPPPYDVDAT